MFMENGKHKFGPSDQVFPLLLFYRSLLLQKN